MELKMILKDFRELIRPLFCLAVFAMFSGSLFAQPLPLPYSDGFTVDYGWQPGWGIVQMANGKLLIQAAPSSTSGAASLVGGQNWTNYQSQVQADFKTGQSATLTARTIDFNNYVGCVFYVNKVQIQQVLNGVTTTLKTVSYPFGTRQEIESAAIAVNGNTASCYMRGTLLSSATISSSLSAGTIGFKTYDPTLNNSELDVSSLSVTVLGTPPSPPPTPPTSTSTPPTPGTAQAIPVLAYHGIINTPDGVATNVLTSDFLNQMQSLKAAGWNTITMSQYIQYMNGQITLPQNSFLLTFDDGRKDSFYNGEPVLESVGFNAIMFLISKYALQASDPFYLAQSEVQTMLATGRWDLEAHAKNGHDAYPIDAAGALANYDTNLLWNAPLGRLETPSEYNVRMNSELSGIVSDLQAAFGVTPRALAYPFNDYGQLSVNFPSSVGILNSLVPSYYLLSFYNVNVARDLTFNYANLGLAKSRRIEVVSGESPAALLNILNNGLPKTLPYSDSLSQNNGWSISYGNAYVANGQLDVNSGAGTSGASLLDGSGAWVNYALTSNLTFANAQSATVAARLTDFNNYLGCVYGQNAIKIVQVVNGVSTTLQGNLIISPPSTIPVGILVQGNTVSCTLNGRVRASATFSGLSSGGVGFKVSDPTVTNDEIIVTNLNVSPL